MKNIALILGAASLALTLPATPAHAGGDITNFNVKNCTQERIFVCSFDKTDSAMNIPYKARRIQPKDKKEFGCASLNKCKVIIGVSKKTSKSTMTTTTAALMPFEAGGAVLGGAGMAAVSGASAGVLVVGVIAAAVVSVIAAGAVAGLEISDGWSDGEVCNQVRKAAQKAGMKPKYFMKDGKNYQVIEKYAIDRSGNFYVNYERNLVLAYTTEADRGKCPAPLNTVPPTQ